MQMNRAYRYLVTGVYLGLISAIIGYWAVALAPQRFTTSNLLLYLGHGLGLVAVIVVLGELLMMARVPLIERGYSLDELTRIHRINGYVVLAAMTLHICLTTIGYQLTRGQSFIGQLVYFSRNFEDVFQALLGFTIFIAVTLSSVKLAKQKVSYEIWYFLHILAYLAIVLTFGHQIHTGPDFIAHPWLVIAWYGLYGLYGLTAALIAWFRFAVPLLSLWRYELRVHNIIMQTHDSYTVQISGSKLQRFNYLPGQFAVWYFLSPKAWWQGHPFFNELHTKQQHA